jgi:hypothetical protein
LKGNISHAEMIHPGCLPSKEHFITLLDNGKFYARGNDRRNNSFSFGTGYDSIIEPMAVAAAAPTS